MPRAWTSEDYRRFGMVIGDGWGHAVADCELVMVNWWLVALLVVLLVIAKFWRSIMLWVRGR